MTTLQEFEHPWRNKELLERLYWDKRLHMGEIAERLGCTRRTLITWFDRFDIETRKGKPRKPWVYYETHSTGYEHWQDDCVPSRGKVCKVHRLAAVAWFGWDAIQDKHVHHKNGIPWDNRKENLELLTPSEHSRRHVEQGDSISNKMGLIAQHGTDWLEEEDES